MSDTVQFYIKLSSENNLDFLLEKNNIEFIKTEENLFFVEGEGLGYFVFKEDYDKTLEVIKSNEIETIFKPLNYHLPISNEDEDELLDKRKKDYERITYLAILILFLLTTFNSSISWFAFSISFLFLLLTYIVSLLYIKFFRNY